MLFFFELGQLCLLLLNLPVRFSESHHILLLLSFSFLSLPFHFRIGFLLYKKWSHIDGWHIDYYLFTLSLLLTFSKDVGFQRRPDIVGLLRSRDGGGHLVGRNFEAVLIILLHKNSNCGHYCKILVWKTAQSKVPLLWPDLFLSIFGSIKRFIGTSYTQVLTWIIKDLAYWLKSKTRCKMSALTWF